MLCLNTCATYLSDVSDVDSRSLRIGVLYALEILCLPVANGVGGWMLHNHGFLNTYLICLGCTGVALVLGVCCIEDVSVPVERPVSVVSAFNLFRLTDSFKTLFKKSLGRRKMTIVVLLLVIHVTVWFPYQGR